MTERGPSSDAWGVPLAAPALVAHQGKLLAFARPAQAPVDTLYFEVFDPAAGAASEAGASWNGWYRFEFPRATAAAGNARAAAEAPPPELRLAGMDLLTVGPAAATAAPADADFEVLSDDNFIYLFRRSQQGTLYVDRLMLLTQTEQVFKQTVTRYQLETAWEVRYRGSGQRDVPETDTDSQSFLGPTGVPFLEPTLELSGITGITASAFSVARVPTADPERWLWYVACGETDGVQLYSFSQSGSLPDFSAAAPAGPRLEPRLAPGGEALAPLTGRSPALLFYAEHDSATAASGDEVELQRNGRLMLAIPVAGAGLEAATAIYDFSLAEDGGIPALPASGQAVLLVDGKLEAGKFVPDATSPSFPTPEQAAQTVQVVEGLTVDSMLLGQVQPHTDPLLRMGEDGLVHLYYGGPPAAAGVRWGPLVPGQPVASVAQFDPRVSRAVVELPWRSPVVSEQGGGVVRLLARQSGPIMEGSRVTVADVSFGSGAGARAQPDLCTVTIAYPSASGLPRETWTGVPREVGLFAAVLNGGASGDSADPAVAAGSRPFFDFSGKLALARVPVAPPGAPAPPAGGPYPPALSFVSTRGSISLTAVEVEDEAGGRRFELSFADTAGTPITQVWAGLPAVVDSYADLFSGAAAGYAYAPGPGSTPLFALDTDATGVWAPALLYPGSTSPDLAGLAITVAVSAADKAKLDVRFELPGQPQRTAEELPAPVEEFAAALRGAAAFKDLGLQIDVEGAGGGVRTTAQAETALDLREGAVLFDLVGSPAEVTGMAVAADTYPAGRLGHAIEPAGEWDPSRMAGFLASYEAPDSGAPAYVADRAGATVAGAHRTLAGRGAPAEPQSGGWLRQVPAAACKFAGTDSVTVPVAEGGAVVPASIRLRPTLNWTLESWLRPAGTGQRLLTFHDAVTKVAPGAPALDYRFDVVEGSVLEFGHYEKQPGVPDSTFFTTGTVAGIPVLPEGAFTWEAWVQPQATPAPSGGGASPPLGGIVQAGNPRNPNPAFVLGLRADRHVVIRVGPPTGATTDLVSAMALAATDAEDGAPLWTHVAVTASQAPGGSWTLRLYLDGELDSTFPGIAVSAGDLEARLTIGANTPQSASLFGQLAHLRLWAAARTAGELRRTLFMSTVGTEPGLLGSWPLTAIAQGPSGYYLEDTVAKTEGGWRALRTGGRQPAQTVADDVFLALAASVGGGEPVKAQTMLVSGRWNHLAVVYSGGGALALNLGARYEAGECDWMQVGGEGLTTTGSFALDTWITIPERSGQPGTIAARWAWDEDPENQVFNWQVDGSGNLTFAVKIVTDDEGKVETATAKSAGTDFADGASRHVAAVFEQVDAGSGKKAGYELSLYADGTRVGFTSGEVEAATCQPQGSDIDLLVGRSQLEPATAPPPSLEAMEPLRGVIGRLRLWSSSPSTAALFPERQARIPTFGPPSGLVSVWNFEEQEGTVAADAISSNDGILTSSEPWSTLRATSSLQFLANGGLVAGVAPYAGLAAASSSQFSLGAPLESGVPGFAGELGQLSIWEEARSPLAIRRQRLVPFSGDEPGLVACWDFGAGGADITGGGNDPRPPIEQSRIVASSAPLGNEGGIVLNAYGGIVGQLTGSTPGRLAVAACADVERAPAQPPVGVLLREYWLDAMAAPSEPIQVGLLDLVYLGQAQTNPTLVGYIEGAPPVPSENLTRPYYISGIATPTYDGSASVALIQREADKVTYRSKHVNASSIDFSFALGLFGVKSNTAVNLFFGWQKAADTKSTIQGLFQLKDKWGTEEGRRLAAEWSSEQRDEATLWGDWEPYQEDPEDYLSPLVGRRFQPANLGYALVESLTADVYAMVFHATGTAVGTITVPDPAIPPDRNILTFPLNPEYVKAGTLDGKVGLANDPDLSDADRARGSYFQPGQAYALAAAIEQAQQRDRSFAEQFNAEARGKALASDIEDAAAELPVDFGEQPAAGAAAPVPVQGIANRYVWSAQSGLHAERHSYAAASTRIHVGFQERAIGGGLKGTFEAYVFGLGWQGGIDLLGLGIVSVEVGREEEEQRNIELEVKLQGEPYLRRWDPQAPSHYGGLGAFAEGLAPGKVLGYRFMSFLLPPSSANGAKFEEVVDPVWKRLSNEPAARALRELRAVNPAWRVLHRVTYVERVPPPVSSRPLYTVGDEVREPVNLEGNLSLLRLIAAALGESAPTPLNLGGAIAVVLNPAPTEPGKYPASVLEGMVPWWREFLEAARPGSGGSVADPAAAELLAKLVGDVLDYVVAGYRTGAIPRLLAG